MTTATATEKLQLEIRRPLSASPEQVFRAWTDPHALAMWFAPSDEYVAIVHEADLRIGGTYRIEMRHKNGAAHTAVGNYREIAPNRRLSFTWRWLENAAMDDTLVTIDLASLGDGTALTLRHQNFVSVEARDEHEKGWNGCLSRLPNAF